MAVTLADFKAQFPEFAQAGDTVISAELANALQLTPASVWGTLQDQGVRLRTAVALANRPPGRGMQFKPEQVTVYDARLRDLESVVAGGGTVL